MKEISPTHSDDKRKGYLFLKQITNETDIYIIKVNDKQKGYLLLMLMVK